MVQGTQFAVQCSVALMHYSITALPREEPTSSIVNVSKLAFISGGLPDTWASWRRQGDRQIYCNLRFKSIYTTTFNSINKCFDLFQWCCAWIFRFQETTQAPSPSASLLLAPIRFCDLAVKELMDCQFSKGPNCIRAKW
jgi:hypothetical protein